MAIRKSSGGDAKARTVQEAFALSCVDVKVLKSWGPHKVGSKVNLHKSTAEALAAKKLVELPKEKAE